MLSQGGRIGGQGGRSWNMYHVPKVYLPFNVFIAIYIMSKMESL